MKKICSYCKVVLEKGPEPASHGICAACLEVEIGKVRDLEAGRRDYISMVCPTRTPGLYYQMFGRRNRIG